LDEVDTILQMLTGTSVDNARGRHSFPG
jgi:hypothetical protein